MGENIDKAVKGMKASHSDNKIKHKCNVANFQIELQDRHRICHTPFQHLCKQDLQPIAFASTSKMERHKTDPSKLSSFMSISGDHFIPQDVGPSAEKNLCSTVTKHCGKTVCEFHKWHTIAPSHMQQCNKHLHPHKPFTSDMTNPKGFTVGDGVDDATPARHDTIIVKDDRLLWDALTTAFDKDTTEHITVQAHNGSGFAALKSLVARSHPAIAPEPSKPILVQPAQGKLNILKHMHQCEHWLVLRSHIKNTHASLNDKIEKQHFISGCNHSAFIKDQIRCERDIPACAHKFAPSASIVTINGCLDLPNSPTERQLTRLQNPHPPCDALTLRPATQVHGVDMHPTNSAVPNVNDDDASECDDDIHFACTAACQQICNNPDRAIPHAGLNNIAKKSRSVHCCTTLNTECRAVSLNGRQIFFCTFYHEKHCFA